MKVLLLKSKKHNISSFIKITFLSHNQKQIIKLTHDKTNLGYMVTEGNPSNRIFLHPISQKENSQYTDTKSFLGIIINMSLNLRSDIHKYVSQDWKTNCHVSYTLFCFLIYI
jgi:hypothetical protein